MSARKPVVIGQWSAVSNQLSARGAPGNVVGDRRGLRPSRQKFWRLGDELRRGIVVGDMRGRRPSHDLGLSIAAACLSSAFQRSPLQHEADSTIKCRQKSVVSQRRFCAETWLVLGEHFVRALDHKKRGGSRLASALQQESRDTRPTRQARNKESPEGALAETLALSGLSSRSNGCPLLRSLRAETL